MLATPSDDGQGLAPLPGARSDADGGRARVAPHLRQAPARARAEARDAARRLGGRRCDERRHQRQAERRTLRAVARAGGPALAPPQRATLGDYVGLCLLIDFADAPASIPRNEVERFCNQPGYTGFDNNGSVRDYFFDQSLGRCRYTNLVAPYYRARFPKSYYTDRTVPMGTRARELIREALAHHLAHPQALGFDLSALTADGQGFVYATNVYYAGEVENNWSEGLWPHAWMLGTAVPLAPGKAAFDYQFTAMGQALELGTFCHENGHMLCDYPDLYDYGGESGGVGHFCLMCAGNHADPRNPTGISGYLKRLSGWGGRLVSLAGADTPQTVTLQAGANDIALLPRDDGEYFLLEARHRSGRDAALPGSGLAIWHCDEEGDNSDEAMTAAKHYELALEQADGRFELEASPRELGDAQDLFADPTARFADDTTPSSRWWNGTSSKLVVDQVELQGSTVKFRARVGDAAPPAGKRRVQRQPQRPIPDHTPAGITDTLEQTDAFVLEALAVGVEITHPWRGDLQVELTAPWGARIVLHAASQGGDADDLRATFTTAEVPALATWRGRPAQGVWTLTTSDRAPSDTGTLVRWWIDFTPAAAVPGNTTVTLKEAPGAAIPDAPAAGLQRVLSTTAPGTLTALQVEVDIVHSWIGDLEVTLTSPQGQTVWLHSRLGAGADRLQATYTVATTPALAAILGQPRAGQWTLRVVDRERVDVGKLLSWGMTLAG